MRIAASLIALVMLTATAHASTVRISEIHPNPSTGREFVELWNPTTNDVDITNWLVDDAAGNNYTMPNWVLSPNERVVIWGGGQADAWGPAWSRATAWNNGGDTASLYDSAGVLQDQIAYGSGQAHAPGPDESLELDGVWRIGAPTPGRAPGSHGGHASFEVENAPPTIELTGPVEARPDEVVSIHLEVHDANGDDITWNLQGQGLDEVGNASGSYSLPVSAPTATGPWTITATASDGQASTEHVLVVEVVEGILRIDMPPQGIRFANMTPGARDVQSTHSMTLHNAGNASLVPRIDVSDFRGPTTIAVENNLQFVTPSGIVAYDGPLAQLPELGPGESYTVAFKIAALPDVLPAGTYATSFAVMA